MEVPAITGRPNEMVGSMAMSRGASSRLGRVKGYSRFAPIESFSTREKELKDAANSKLAATRSVHQQPFAVGVQISIQDGQIKLGQRVRQIGVEAPQLANRHADPLHRQIVLFAQTLQDEGLDEIPEGHLLPFAIREDDRSGTTKPGTKSGRPDAKVVCGFHERIGRHGPGIVPSVDILRPFASSGDYFLLSNRSDESFP